MYAKSNPPITLEEHNQDLKNNFQILQEFLPKAMVKKYKETVLAMLELHDLGKINSKFQKKLKIQEVKEPDMIKDLKEIPHEQLSLAFISQDLKRKLLSLNIDEINIFNVFRYAISKHHTRDTELNQDDYETIVKYDLESNKSKIGINYPLNQQIDLISLENYINDNLDKCLPYLVFFKGVLHKCDYAASARIPCEIKYNGSFDNSFSQGIDFELREFQQNAKSLRDKSVVLIASTGMGKTEYSMNWMGGEKSFYLLGLQIAVNAMYKRFQKLFGDNVALLHGNANYQILQESDSQDDYNSKIAKAKQLSYPITIATADQLVTSVFKYNGFELPYLTASYSKIVIDEIQSFSPESIACIVVFLQEISRLGGKFLLMTATLPTFIKNEFANITYMEKPQLLVTKRHKIEVIECEIENFDFSSISSKKMLIICNTVAKAQSIYAKLQDQSPNLIHSKFIMNDRKCKENEILQCKEGIWISTQIVESSLDIDFDLLLTECSTIDGILQRFGRCYRKREYTENQPPNIFVFKYDAISQKIYDPKLLERTFTILKKYSGKLLNENDKQEMIEWVFKDIEKLNSDYFQKFKEYKALLKSGFRAKKSEAQELFRKISNTHTIIPMPIYNSHKDEIDHIIQQIDSSKGINKLKLKEQLYGFSISLQIFDREKEKTLLKPFPQNSTFLHKENLYLLDGVDYSYETGMSFIKEFKDMSNFIF